MSVSGDGVTLLSKQRAKQDSGDISTVNMPTTDRLPVQRRNSIYLQNKETAADKKKKWLTRGKQQQHKVSALNLYLYNYGITLESDFSVMWNTSRSTILELGQHNIYKH
ncbi:hypothetical protein PNOK_0829500 [Pyrrhoderma noxium]|uniref:Uncharacterized protein n=1 Tax=Pyrrhoderma noxium TaxID=2282107 RepID=A0A286UAU7_9AGAM|nr:hypothetical protein PNOK_0829500 [Pyrrhoderma noxium]